MKAFKSESTLTLRNRTLRCRRNVLIGMLAIMLVTGADPRVSALGNEKLIF